MDAAGPDTTGKQPGALPATRMQQVAATGFVAALPVALLRLAAILVVAWVACAVANAAEYAARPAAASRVRAAVVSPVGDEFLVQARSAWHSIPDRVWSGLERAGWQVKLAQFVTDAAPDLRGVQPRGWPAGTTWENTDAVHLPGARTLVFAEKRRDARGRIVASSRVEGVMRHEIGHAFDLAVGGGKACSCSAEFLAAYLDDARRVPAAERRQLVYYFQRGDAGRQETFAEAFAILLGGGSDAPHREAFMRSFPRVLEHVRRTIAGFDARSDGMKLARQR